MAKKKGGGTRSSIKGEAEEHDNEDANSYEENSWCEKDVRSNSDDSYQPSDDNSSVIRSDQSFSNGSNNMSDKDDDDSNEKFADDYSSEDYNEEDDGDEDDKSDGKDRSEDDDDDDDDDDGDEVVIMGVMSPKKKPKTDFSSDSSSVELIGVKKPKNNTSVGKEPEWEILEDDNPRKQVKVKLEFEPRAMAARKHDCKKPRGDCRYGWQAWNGNKKRKPGQENTQTKNQAKKKKK